MRYYTRKGVHIDRCASGWLIRRFVDPAAEFFFVEPGKAVPDAIPFDISGAELGHRRGRCTFEAILEKHGLRDPALVELGRIVRSADLLASADETLEGAGLDLLFRGLRLTLKDDGEIIARAGEIFDALYAALQERGGARERRATRKPSHRRR